VGSLRAQLEPRRRARVSKLAQCSGLRFAIGSVRAWVPFRANRQYLLASKRGPSSPEPGSWTAERPRRFADMLGKQLGERIERSVL
jgi:hypothetical protein